MKKYCKICGFVDGEGNIDICPICKSTDWEDADLITVNYPRAKARWAS